MTPLEWEDAPCDWCGSTESQILFKGPDRLTHLPGFFCMVKCCKCGMIRQNPRLTWQSLKGYYSEDYASYSHLLKEEPSFWRRLDVRYGMGKQLRAVEQYQPRGQLLDVGCGTGLFLEEAQRSGRWEVMGIEPNERAATYVREGLGVPVMHGRFAEVDLPAQSFDVITMWHVLEHVEHPVADLRRAGQLLQENGWLVLAVPNVESLGARVFGRYWVGWDMPRHLYLFPRHTLQAILAQLGFRLVATRCFLIGYASLGHSLDFGSQTWVPQYSLLRRLLLRLYYTMPARVMLLFPIWVLDRLGLSTVITFFAQKVSSESAGALR